MGPRFGFTTQPSPCGDVTDLTVEVDLSQVIGDGTVPPTVEAHTWDVPYDSDVDVATVDEFMMAGGGTAAPSGGEPLATPAPIDLGPPHFFHREPGNPCRRLGCL